MYQKTVLDNSIRIITERLPSRLASIGIWVDTGARDEDELTNGSAHFVEHMIFKGTHQRTAQQISRELDMLGGMSNAFTSTEQTCYYATVLASHQEQAVDLLSDIFLNSLFDPEEIDREKQVILQEIAMVEDTPDDRVHELFSSLFWKGHGLGNTVLGDARVVGEMDSSKLLAFVEKFYTSGRIVIAAAGNIDHDYFVGLWQEKLQGIKSATAGALSRHPPQSGNLAACQVINRQLEQAHVIMGTTGMPVNSEDRYNLLLLHIILGGNMSSRLFQEIREKRGLAYSVYSYLSSHSDGGYLAVYLGVDPKTMEEALGLVKREISRLKTNLIAADELNGALQYAKGSMLLVSENMDVRMNRLARNELYFGRYIPIEEVVAGIARVSGEEIMAMSQQVFASEQLAAVAIGPVTEEQIKKEL